MPVPSVVDNSDRSGLGGTMRLQLRTGFAVGVALLVTLLLAQGAHAQEAPSITVTPDSGLVDGQVVEVEGAGFLPDVPGDSGVRSIVLACPAFILDFEPFSPSDLFALLSVCGAIAGGATTDSTGHLSGTLQVAEVMPTVLGGSVVQCGAAPNDCVVLAGSVRLSPRLNPALERYATAFISFGPVVPTTKADCKNGGWRNLANDQAQPFRNQGQCVSYVVAHRR